MAWPTLASTDDVRYAGNFSQKLSEDSVVFYLEIASYYLYDMVGATNYGAAKAGTLDPPQNDKLKKAEACLAVAFALPALGLHLSEMGFVKQMAMARGGEYQSMSFAKEIQELAAAFLNMVHFLVPSDMKTADRYKLGWSYVVQTLFPSTDEHPTRAPIASYSESVIMNARGTELWPGIGQSG